MKEQSDIQIIERQEQVLEFKSFSEEDAWRIGNGMRAEALSRKLPVVIDIRLGMKPLFYTALPGTTPENHDWVLRKVNTVMRFERSSYRVGLEYRARGLAFDQSRGIDPVKFAPAGGGFPIRISGVGVTGCVTVSGLPQRDDHMFVVESLSRFLNVPLEGLALQDIAN